MKPAALYLRSSKDRSDVSIDAQRRELTELAAARGYIIVAEHVDVVLSGKDENRAGFQALIRDIKSKERTWCVIMVLDTSRIARNQYTAHCFRHECKKRAIDMVFAKTPELDGIAGILLPAVMMAMDEVHSFMSREKGLAGMAENVKQGWRAGGRAPFGYDLEKIATGAVRDGEPVTKSRLIPNSDAPRIQQYLRGRIANQSATDLAERLGLDCNSSTLTGYEWNALTYAGHTVWNVHNQRTTEGYKTGAKRKPRGEWLINYDTHPGVITTEQAEALIARLERGRTRYNSRSNYLLAGIMATPDGRAWQGNAGYYRTGSKNISAPRLEEVVLAQLARDLDSPAFINALVRRARAAQSPTDGSELTALEREIKAIDNKINRLMDLAAEADAPAPYTRKIAELDTKKAELEGRRNRAQHTAKTLRVLHQVTDEEVRALLGALASQIGQLDREELKSFLKQILLVELCPTSLNCNLRYSLPLAPAENCGVMMASPRRTPDIPTLRHVSKIKVIPGPRGRKKAC